ncbi:MAG: FAD-dependent oxidoreductase [Mesorhizobium sp.]|nr:MAG: FAD-dependent oxidoreductase [Mesorhizobium sp.]
MRVLVKGAGVAGLTAAFELAARGAAVTVAEIRHGLGGNASWMAGGMLAPWCERESADEAVLTLGRGSADWWDAVLPDHVLRNGTLVLAPARDAGELNRFGRRTSGFRQLDQGEIAALEPALAGRFGRGLFFAEEAHLDPRKALLALCDRLLGMGARFEFGGGAMSATSDIEVDCTGIADSRPELRGVRGEMLVLRTREISLARPVRLLHPRIPVYVVPRSESLFMVGATMIECNAAGPITARSTMELVSGAYALHPAFGEAELVETSVGVRPAFADNLPRVEREGKNIRINGLYRHGFLLAPAMARQAADIILGNEGSKGVCP